MDLPTGIGSRCRRLACRVSPAASIARAAEIMREHHVGSVLVVEKERPVGIVTDRDIALRTFREGLDPAVTEVAAIMTAPAVSVAFDASVAEAIGVMRTHRIRRLPVLSKDGTLYGVVAMDDLLITLGRQLGELGRVIRREQANETGAGEP